MDALKNALLKALVESGQLTQEMVEELRGEGQGDEAVQQQIADLLDDLIQRMVEEGYLTLEQGARPCPGRSRTSPEWRDRRSQRCGPACEIQLDPEGHRLPRLRGTQEPSLGDRKLEFRLSRNAPPRDRGRV